jgi:hypothetical protein
MCTTPHNGLSQHQKHGIHLTLVTEKTSLNEVSASYWKDVCLGQWFFAFRVTKLPHLQGFLALSLSTLCNYI